ncbi:uncharacterized protein LOC143452119 [Clavelina lepadiformis]|uniref:uncharacterized protein LOC143452119 n=1 Tax=Clavelina lepadiformis TaxID=159417 RepID=UPI0040419557
MVDAEVGHLIGNDRLVPSAPPVEDFGLRRTPPPPYYSVFPTESDTFLPDGDDEENIGLEDDVFEVTSNTEIDCEGTVNCPSIYRAFYDHELNSEFSETSQSNSQYHMPEEKAKKILLDSILKRPSRNKAVNDINITGIEMFQVLRYSLRTVVEYRSIDVVEVPYKIGTHINRIESKVPDIWQIETDIPNSLCPVTLKIPGSSKRISCKICTGRGAVICEPCYGSGQVTCTCCHGSGKTESYNSSWNPKQQHPNHESTKICYRCGGRGKESCGHCFHMGRRPCCGCDSSKEVVKYEVLKVKWKPLRSVYYENHKHLPEKVHEMLASCKEKRVSFDSHFDKFLLVSQVFLEAHDNHARRGVIRKQKQDVCEIPVYKIQGLFKDQEMTYWIVGHEKMVYAPNHRRRLTRSCIIM